MTDLSHKVARTKGEWVSVKEYAKRHKIKNPEVLYVRMLKNQVVWREVDTIVKRKEIFDK